MQKQLFSIKEGNYETRISQKKAKKLNRVKNYSLMIGLVFAIFAVAPAVSSILPALASSPTGTYTANLNSTNGTTWSYDIELEDPSEPANGISHISIQTCFTQEQLNSGVLVSTSPNGGTPGDDGSTGFNDVIKWDFSFNDPTTVSFTLDDVYGTDGTATIIAKYGSTHVALDLPGPNCDPAPEPAKLTIIKDVTNDDGGTASASDFEITIAGPSSYSNTLPGEGSPGKELTNLEPGTYTVSEADVTGYVQEGISCDNGDSVLGDGDLNVELDQGDDVTCIVYNNDIFVPDPEAELTLIKNVVNDDGGTASATDWTLTAAGPDTVTGTTGTPDVTGATVDPGTYTLSESGGPAGYTAGDWSCSLNGGTAVTGSSVTLADGDSAVCTIVNDDDPVPTGTLTLVKTVVNDNVGTLTKNDFQAYIDGNSADWDTAVVLAPGSYQVSEDAATGYSASDWGGDCDTSGNVTVVAGENKTCTITNDDIAPTLTLVKTVINDDGGTLTESDFQAQIDGNNVDWNVAVILDAGNHTASELIVAGYTASDWGGDCAANGGVTLALAENKTCTITNNDIFVPDPEAELTLIKNVVNDDGGTASATDWTLTAAGPDTVTGTTGTPDVTGATVDPGTYTLSESGGPAGYTAGDWSCSLNGGTAVTGSSVTLADGDSAVCTIVNDDDPIVPTPPTLTLEKVVINDNGRNATEADFQGQIDGADVPWDTAQTLTAGTYTVSEIMNVSNYRQESIVCDNGETGGSVTLSDGDDVTCTITNNDRPRTSSGSPTLTIEKTVTPTITDPGTTVNYTIVVSNVGNRTAINVVLEDVLPAGFTYTATGLGTQSWSLGNMGPGDSQTITYEVDVDPAVLPGDYVNVAETSADNHGPVSDDATVTVRGVLGEEFEPVLEITKVGDREIINPGGQINYTVTITNVGEAPAINLVVTDTLPEGFTSADTGLGVITWNVDRLDVGDTWEVSFLVDVSEDIETQPLDEDAEGEQEVGTYVNEVRANAENYDGELFASYVVAARGEVLGETGAGARDIAVWFTALLALAGSALLVKRELLSVRS